MKSSGAVDARAAALDGLFDDASTFPPLRRELAAALAAHVGTRVGAHGHLVGRFMVAVDQISQLVSAMASEHPDDEAPLAVAVVLPRSGAGSPRPVVRADLARLQPLADAARVQVQCLEMSLTGPDPLADVPEVLAGLAAAGLASTTPLSFEIPLAGRAAGEVVRRINAIADARDEGADMLVKLRLAGSIAGTTPTEVEVAGFLRACADAELPLQMSLAAGLAGRFEDAGTGDVAYGFLNLLAAAGVAYRGGNLEEIREAVRQPAEQIRLGPGALIVGGVVLDSDVLEDVRRDFLRTISCADLAEPVQELVAMGVLDPGGLSGGPAATGATEVEP